MKINKIKTSFSLLAVLVSVFLLFWGVFFGKISIPYRSDYIRFLTQQISVVNQILAGHFPLWNAYVFCGVPMVSNVMTNLFSPFLIIYFLIKDPLFAYMAVTIIEEFLIGATMFFMIRSIFKVDRLSAYICAIVFMLCGFMFWLLNISFKSIVDLLFIYPLAFVAYYKLRENISFKWSILISVVLAVGYINCNGSALQLAYNMVFLFLFHIYFLFFNRKEDIKQEIKITLHVCFAIGFNLFLCAFQFLPFYEAIMHSTRFSKVLQIPHPLYKIILGFIYPDMIPKFAPIIPKFYIFHYGVIGYIGISSLILALIGAFYFNDKKKWFFVFYPLAYLVIGPIYTLAFVQTLLPAFIKCGNHYYYSYYLCAFCMAVLAGLGMNVIVTNKDNLNKILSSKKNALRIIKITVICLLILYLAAFAGILCTRIFITGITKILQNTATQMLNAKAQTAHPIPYYMDKIKYIMLVFKNNFYLFLISHIAKIAGLILCYIIITKRKPLAKPIFYFLTVCVFIDLLAVSQQYMEFMPRQDYYPQKKSLSFLQEKSKKDIFRVGVLLEDATWFFKNNPNASFAEYNNFLNSDNQKLHENIIIYYGLQAISSQSGLYPQRQYDYFRLHKKNMDYGLSPQGVRFTNLESTLLNLVNMKYIITPAELSYRHYKKVFSDEKYIVYENLNAFPRAFWVPEAKYIAKKDNLFSLLSSDKVDFTKTVLISENQPPARLLISAKNSNANGNIKIKQYSPNKIIIQSDYNQDGWLVLADAYYPGWSAYIGDVKTNIYPANHLLRTVFVPAGTKTITFRYFSNYMLAGIWISSFSWCAAGLILLFCAKKK